MFIKCSSNDVERVQSGLSDFVYHLAIDRRAASLIVFLENIILRE